MAATCGNRRGGQWRSRLTELSGGRVVVAGIGSEIRGDDAAGLAVARTVAESTSVTAVECGPAPENFISAISRMRPDVVLLVDAADLAAAPGTVAIVPLAGPNISTVGPHDALAEDPSTHSASLSLTAGQIGERCGADVYLVAIQPADLKLGGPLSPAVAAACSAIVEAINSATR